MNITILKPVKFLRPLHRKQDISTEILGLFKQYVQTFLANIHEPSREGKQENDLRDFLNDAFYKKNYYINKKETIDWAIHNGTDAKSKVAVLIEVKKTAEKNDMLSDDKPNVKAFHELVLYYLRERIEYQNHEIKHLIATNGHEWFIFNELWFNEYIFTAKFKKTYLDWKLSGHSTDDFYKLHAKSYLETLTKPLVCCKIDLRTYAQASDKQWTELYKILSPEHLLKLEIANDANKLNKPFYNELLYLIGIEERKDANSNKKVIERLSPAERFEGSLLENTIEQLVTKNALAKVQDLEAFGQTYDEQLYSIALELCITWLNRLLFLKLLEGQLVKYHDGDRNYRFLSSDKIGDFDELGELFFGVLAKKPSERTPSVREKFGDIPYLNSSLFEETTLESAVLSIELLKDRLTLPFFGATVLKNNEGKTKKGNIKTLNYVLDFLDAYDFGSTTDIDSKATGNGRVINAAVLGLIFEKLNGYKDGSFFTPSFITMYMCRETLRRAVVQKLSCIAPEGEIQRFEDIAEHLDFKKPEQRQHYNDLLNSIRICDPAVGSGHFLVSALNEMIVIKAELNILQHPNGTRIKDYEITVENDELIVWDEETQRDFQYRVGLGGKPITNLQLMQETLFYEKRTLIENCLFGVDINPKSVSICQLRLWIELLKNAFYTSQSNFSFLETLPNIDINIKTGNSLVSRFGLEADLSKVLRSIKYNVSQYRGFVQDYKNAESKEEKRGLQRIINDIKANFRTEIAKYSNPKIVQLHKLKEELYVRFEGNALFGNQLNKMQLAERDKLVDKIETLSEEIKDSIDSPIFRNAFEWRFEFPEVLDDKGNFVGFDVVVGNPPYIRQEEFSVLKPYLQEKFECFTGTADLFVYFIELALKRLHKKGEFTFIIPNKWMKAGYGKRIRTYLQHLRINSIIDFADLPVFEEATTYPCILSVSATEPQPYLQALEVPSLNFPNGLAAYFQEHKVDVLLEELSEEGWTLSKSDTQGLIAKLKKDSKTLGEFVNKKIFYGVKTGLNEAFIIDEATKNQLIEEDANSAEIIKPFLDGKDIKRYQNPLNKKWLIFTRRGIDITKYPAVLNYLTKYRIQLEPKPKNSTGKDVQGRKPGSYLWYEIQDAVDYYEEFEKPKIVWAETSNGNQFCRIEEGIYLNKTTFMMPIEDPVLLAIMNSKLMEFYMGSIVSKVRGGYFSMSKAYVETAPIRYPSETTIFTEKVNQILALKKADSLADTYELEAEIDRMVYALYELSEEEIAIVEGQA